jgi:hypothetical protein
MRVKLSILALMAVASNVAHAQRGADTLLKGSTIEVIQTYKPKIKQTPKPEWKPQLPPADTSRPNMSLEVPQQTLYYSYNSPPLRPLALGKTTAEQPFANYVKVGGGNLSTAYLDAGIGALRGDDYETNIRLHHISQKGSIKNQQTSLSGIEADGAWHHTAGEINGGVAVSRNQYHYYGYDHTLYDYAKEDVRQTYTNVKLHADFANKQDTAEQLSYNPGIYGSYLSGRLNTNEVTVGIKAPVSYKINNNLGLRLDLDGAITSYKADTLSVANNFITAAPGVTLAIDNYTAHALGGFAIGKGGKSYFLPDVEVAFNMQDYLFRLAIGWKATLRQNTYEQMTNENPFMLNTYPVFQSKKDEIFAQVRGALGDHFSYMGKASWLKVTNLATFLNDTGDRKEMYVQYQNINALCFQGGVRYEEAQKWAASLMADYNNFYNSTESYVWHEPTMRIKADFSITPIKNLQISAYYFMLAGIKARNQFYEHVTLDPVTDLGLYAEYSFISRLSAFMNVSNLLNTKYERWYGYEAYGLNIYAGVRLKF